MQGSPPNPADRAPRRDPDRLAALPIRPATARALHDATASPSDLAADPGLALARSRGVAPGAAGDAPGWPIDLPWWSATPADPAGADARQRLWRHALAIALAARRLAHAEGGVDPDLACRAGLLQPLGLWSLAATDPGRLADWIRADAGGRRERLDRWFGGDLLAFGRRLAERWGVEPLVLDAVTLGADAPGTLGSCAHDPAGLLVIQRASALARRTPWSLDPDPRRDLGPPDPAVRALTAEVQARTSSPFVAPDATPREEALTRSHARLRLDLDRATRERDAGRSLLGALAASPVGESPAEWAARTAHARDGESGDRAAEFAPLPRAWDSWGRLVADRDRLASRLDGLLREHRAGRDHAAADEERSRLAALAEFAAGAGHELNNPLAVIMGRAQLLLARSADPEASRSLRAIIAQAQRSHRILRDLMFVARPPEFRPRACQPDEIVRASLRDLRDEAEARGVTLVADLRGPAARVWADPEPLRQVADALARNALEASPGGSTVRFATGADARGVSWTVHDAGRGIAPHEGPHLFDPFFCGRAAGRGLGLGLPRAARIAELLGGNLRWRSEPGRGTTFRVRWPAEPIPGPVEGLAPPASPRPAGDQAERA